MSSEERPFICSCSFCGDGLLRMLECSTCDSTVALCDECELMWADIPAVSDDSNLSSDSSYPRCPSCGDSDAEFRQLSLDDVREAKLEQFTDGESV